MEENEGGAEGRGGEGYVVERVDTGEVSARLSSQGCVAGRSLHVCGELAKGLVEVVHLGQNTDASDDHKDVGRWMRELVVAAEGQLQGNAKGLD